MQTRYAGFPLSRNRVILDTTACTDGRNAPQLRLCDDNLSRGTGSCAARDRHSDRPRSSGDLRRPQTAPVPIEGRQRSIPLETQRPALYAALCRHTPSYCSLSPLTQVFRTPRWPMTSIVACTSRREPVSLRTSGTPDPLDNTQYLDDDEHSSFQGYAARRECL